MRVQQAYDGLTTVAKDVGIVSEPVRAVEGGPEYVAVAGVEGPDHWDVMVGDEHRAIMYPEFYEGQWRLKIHVMARGGERWGQDVADSYPQALRRIDFVHGNLAD